MTFTQALHALANGAPAVVSAIGKRYTAAELPPKKLGADAAVCNVAGMTLAERKGEWSE